MSLHLACHHGLLIFLRDRFIYVHITPYTVSIGVLIGDLAFNFRFLRQLHTCPETNPLFTGRRHSWSAVALTASCEPAVISSLARITASEPVLDCIDRIAKIRTTLLLLLADCSGYHPSNLRSTSYSFISSVRRCAKTRMARQTATEAPSTNPHLSPTSRPPEFEAWCHPANCQRLHNFQLMSL